MSNTDTFIESPLPSKSPFLTFLSHENNNNNNNNNRRQSTMEQLTKGLSNFTLGTKNGYKTTTTNKLRAVGIENYHDTTTPSDVDSDSDSDSIYNIPERLPLRVVNPDPLDGEEEEQEEPDKHIKNEEENKDKEEEEFISNKPMNINNNNNSNSNNNDTIPTKYVIQTISPFSNPSEQKNNHMNNNNNNNDNTKTTLNDNVKPSIVRRQSKTLDEESKPNLLPPVDTTPFNSTHFTTDASTSYHVYHPITSFNNNNNNNDNDNDNIVSSSFSHHQQQNSLSPIPESINQPELLLKPIDSSQINTSSSTSPTLLLPNFTSNNNIDTRNSIDYLNSPHPSNVGSTSYAKYTTQSSSKYTKASYSLTNNPGSLSLYRDMAKKTRDKSVQYSYACYLLEIAKLYDQGRNVKHNKLTSIKHSLSDASYRFRQELSQPSTRQSIDASSIKSSSSSTPSPPSVRLQSLFNNNNKNKKNSLPASPTPSITTSTGRSSFQLKGGYQIPSPSFPLSPTATTVDTLITTTTTANNNNNNNNNMSPIGSPSTSTYQHLHYQPFNFENSNNSNKKNILQHDFNNNDDNKNGSSNNHRRKKRDLEEEGIHWMKRLAKENVPQATFTLATWMDQSLYGFHPNPTKTFSLYDVAAKAGNQEAVFRIGLYYESINDYKNAYQCIKQASDNGITQATVKLFKVHLHGELKQRQNMTLAISLLYKATLSADESDPEPLYLFGLILSNTYPDADIPSEVVEQYGGEIGCLPYFEKAVQHGYTPAHSALGYILEHGLYGVQTNYAKCYIHYAESSKKGDARGMLGLSRLNNKGSNGPDDDMDYQIRMNADESGWLAQREPNEENSFYWCEKAAIEHGLSEAEFLLGWYYEIGLGIPRDYAKAQWFYKRAASKGNAMAIKRLLNQDNSVSKQQHDFIKNTNVISKNYLDHRQSKNITSSSTKKRESQQCSIM